MSADDGLDLRIDQRIEDVEDLASGHSEDMGDALRLERAHDELSTPFERQCSACPTMSTS